MTNAEVIRQMSDEQLLDFLERWELGDIDYAVTFCDYCKRNEISVHLDCDYCRADWLSRNCTQYGGLAEYVKEQEND